MNPQKTSLRQLIFFALLGAMIFAAKMIMAPLPNIEPVSLMIMIIASVFGWPGFFSVIIYIALEFLINGIALWSISYLYVWLILYFACMTLKNMKSALSWAVLSGFFGLLFGALCALAQIFISGFSGAFAWWVSGIPFDLIHGISNFILALLLFSPLKKALIRLKKIYFNN